MFRISISNEERTVVHIDGHLSESSIDELIRACGSVPDPMILDLTHLSSACTAAVAALRKLRDEGAQLRGTPRYIKLLLNDTPNQRNEHA